MGFRELGIDNITVDRLNKIGVVNPTPIQLLVIPRALSGENILARSQTGGGKTLSYLIPVIQRIKTTQRALILAPTRELAQQIGEVCRSISELNYTVIYGGVGYTPQHEALAQTPDIIISTVGRLKDLMSQGVALLQSLDFFVLDEVDQMVDLGFRDDILQLSTLRSLECQTLCFSATLPTEVEAIIAEILPSQYFRAEIKDESLAVERIEQTGYYVSRDMMDHLLIHTLQNQPSHKAIIFTRSRKMADRLSILLRERGFFAEAMHSDRSQTAREYILSRFKSGETTLIVATDVIARGIDVEDVDVVYNYGLPLEAEQYIHRIGRTARAGRNGRAINFCDPQEKPLVDKVCKLMRRHITMSTSHPYATPDVLKALTTKMFAKNTRNKQKK